MNHKTDKKIKLLTLGNSSVGKSSIVLRFSDNDFSTAYTVTLGVDYK